MSNYQPSLFEKKWQQKWAADGIYKSDDKSQRPKYYVLDMFPYPSGAGLHVGHPLGYIASDIYARYKRLMGFNVLHPMGYDAFGLPAEQYAIQTGQHPAITTEQNIERYREQLDRIGFSFDWSREVKTCDPQYYKWTQWIFIQLFHSWYNPVSHKAEPIDTLVTSFAQKGFGGNDDAALTGGFEVEVPAFSAEQWQQFTEDQKQEILLHFRLAYLSETYVNWCPALGTVLANEEVKEGRSERGGYPVERKRMKQWSLRITAYAERLLNDLEQLEWSESIKELQRNWIGKSSGCSVIFNLKDNKGFAAEQIEVFTTRPDTLYGVSFLVLAPEHPLALQISTPERRSQVNEYIFKAKNRTERERMADVKNVSGVFTGAYAEHPFNGQFIPVWIGDYVLAGYGTGAVMAVPAHDSRDHLFAKTFDLPIIQVVETPEAWDIQNEAFEAKSGKAINSDFLNGLDTKEAIEAAIQAVEERKLGKRKVNYRLRDAIFGRQRYWGEPIPIKYENGLPYTIDENQLPLCLPEIDKFLPTEDGDPPLARAKNWTYEITTMPGWAGSSWYFLRYMDPHNQETFASKSAVNYWQQVDLYLGGAEHATGHLLYARFWMKFLYDRGWVNKQEPFKKMINQGMIQGISQMIGFTFQIELDLNLSKRTIKLALKDGSEKIIALPELDGNKISVVYLSADLLHLLDLKTVNIVSETRVDIACVDMKENELRIQDFLEHPLFDKSQQPAFINPDGIWAQNNLYNHQGELCNLTAFHFYTRPEMEKMSKSKYNVVNPDDICQQYGADTLRLYEMFLGPLEMSKPWNTNGIEGVSRFLSKWWRLLVNDNDECVLDQSEPSKEELKILNKTIKKVKEDIESFSFNTSVSTFMIAVNELSALKCKKRQIIEPLVICMAPFAPHISEELWCRMGHQTSVHLQSFPVYDEKWLHEDQFSYPISINGKVRTNLLLDLSLDEVAVKQSVLSNDLVLKWLDGKEPKKFIFVKGRIVNVVV